MRIVFLARKQKEICKVFNVTKHKIELTDMRKMCAYRILNYFSSMIYFLFVLFQCLNTGLPLRVSPKETKMGEGYNMLGYHVTAI